MCVSLEDVIKQVMGKTHLIAKTSNCKFLPFLQMCEVVLLTGVEKNFLVNKSCYTYILKNNYILASIPLITRARENSVKKLFLFIIKTFIPW